jgi:signal transduction histidine kinase
MLPLRKLAFLRPSANDFSARSHELRNQIQPILFALQRLKDGEPTEHQLRALEMIERQTRQQSFLIEDLLDLNRREIGKIELRRSLVDLRECVQHAAETNQAVVDLKSLKVQLELPADPVCACRPRATVPDSEQFNVESGQVHAQGRDHCLAAI